VGYFVRLLKDTEAEVRTAASLRVTGVCNIIPKDMAIKQVLPCVKELVTDASQHVRGTPLSPLLYYSSPLPSLLSFSLLLPFSYLYFLSLTLYSLYYSFILVNICYYLYFLSLTLYSCTRLSDNGPCARVW
jgi:hypothetical protein